MTLPFDYEKIAEPDFTWPSNRGNWTNHCGLEIHKLGRSAVVIASELPEHRDAGTSITNDAERLAYAVCTRYDILPDKLVWIEHYPDRGEFGESYDLVQFNVVSEAVKPLSGHHPVFGKPRWLRINQVAACALASSQVIHAEGKGARRTRRRESAA